ncbi:hypothetical protein CR513_01813, partial [Mucuna pruriens]
VDVIGKELDFVVYQKDVLKFMCGQEILYVSILQLPDFSKHKYNILRWIFYQLLSVSNLHKFWSIGVLIGLQPLIHVSLRKSRIYFICETIIPFFDLATSILRKYLKDPRSLISNFVEIKLFKRFISNT